MVDIRGDLWDVETDWICITTNGIVKQNGACVMGAGCARQARDRFPGLDQRLGTRIREDGNHVHYLGTIAPSERRLFSFPVKHHWAEDASLSLIRRSAKELHDVWSRSGMDPIVCIPRPGCGNGGLSYENVRPMLEDILDEPEFKIITYNT